MPSPRPQPRLSRRGSSLINHPRSPCRASPLISPQDEVGPPLPPSLPSPTLWIFHLPFVQASHSWRPASLNISPALFIIRLELSSRPRRRRRCSFTHVHQLLSSTSHYYTPETSCHTVSPRARTRQHDAHSHVYALSSHTHTRDAIFRDRPVYYITRASPRERSAAF